jgi:serine protease Do
MSDSIERERCPRCGEAAALAARVCPHCKGSLLVDVVVNSAPSDPRLRYQLAKSLSGLPAPAPSFSAAQQALGIPHAVLIQSVTRETARQILEVVREHKGKGSSTLHVDEFVQEAPARGNAFSFLITVCLLALAGFAIYAWTWRTRNESTEIDMPAGARVAASGPPLDVRAIAERATPATVMLRCSESLGSGFFVGPDLVLTNAHVLCPAGESMRAVFSNGREASAKVVRHDDWLDLAVVKVEGSGVQPLPLGDATGLRTGDRVVFIGTPEGLEFTVHQGIVSNTARSVFGTAFLQIDGNVNSGNSGGPLLDDQGRVVGIVTAKLERADGLGFVLPINYAYDGTSRLLSPPARPQPDAESWKVLLTKVAEADRREVTRLASEKSQPALMALTALPGQGVVAILAQRASSPPRSENVTLLFRTSERVLCEVDALVSDWRKWEGAGDGTGGDSRYLEWLKRNGLLKEVYQGIAPLRLDNCPAEELQGSEVVLQGGDERADRLEV